MSESNPYGVKAGQVWQDCDKRGYGRRVKVVEVGDTHAAVQDTYSSDRPRKGKIRLDRFRPNSTGYRLVEDVK